eukprot:2776109-Prymnesium_polylepis.2
MITGTAHCALLFHTGKMGCPLTPIPVPWLSGSAYVVVPSLRYVVLSQRSILLFEADVLRSVTDSG